MAYRCAAIAFLALVSSCSDRFAPAPLPEGAVPFGPPPIYRTWWGQVEECSGEREAFDRGRWFVMPGVDAFVANGQRVNGLWIQHYRYIVLAENRLMDSLVVRHEMLHDLTGNVGHPPEYFQNRCGGVVQPFPGKLATSRLTIAEADKASLLVARSARKYEAGLAAQLQR